MTNRGKKQLLAFSLSLALLLGLLPTAAFAVGNVPPEGAEVTAIPPTGHLGLDGGRQRYIQL